MINREPTEINAFQFIVLPHTGIQICRNFPVNKEIHIAGDDLFEIGCKYAQKFEQEGTVHLLSQHIAVNRELEATPWIPCDKGEYVYFRLTRSSGQLHMDLVIDTNNGAGKQYKNKVHCVLRGGMRTGFKKFVLASFFVEEHREAAGVRGSLLMDFGNSANVALFTAAGHGPFKDKPLPILEPFDPNYHLRSEDEQILFSSSLALLKVPVNPAVEPWLVMGMRAGELVQLEPMCTSVFAPKKYVRAWPEHLKALEPTTVFRGVAGQRDGLTPMLTFVRMSIEHMLSGVVGRLVNPRFRANKPEIYPIIERIMLTYPLTWREMDKQVFVNLFEQAVQKHLVLDQNLNPKVDVELICSEPVAVAAYLIWESIFQYGVEAMQLMSSTLGNPDGDAQLRLLIVDIGGGSTDIAVVEVFWETAVDGGVDVRFQMIESMRFNRAGDRLTHIIVTALLEFMRKKYQIVESLDFEAESENQAFHLSHRRNAVSKLNELGEAAKKHLSVSERPWQLTETEEFALLACFEPLVGEQLSEAVVGQSPRFELSRAIFEKWVRNDRQCLETEGEPGFMDIFLFLSDLRQNLEVRKRLPHLAVLSGRTSRLTFIKRLTMEHLTMPAHRVRTLVELLPLTIKRAGHENPDKISVVSGAHRFRFGDNVRFIPLTEEAVFNRYIGTVRETPDGLKLNEVFIQPGAEPPHTVALEIHPATDLRIGHCFREDGIAEAIAILSNTSPDRKQQVLIDVLDDFTVKINQGEEVNLIEWVPGGSHLIVDNFNDTGKIDSSPTDFIRNKVIGGQH